jgi:methylglutaconyl-CoA hydratase
MSDPATLTIENGVATVTLNRPDARNALSIPMLETLHGLIDDLARRDDARVAVLTGAGKSFCAGMDLKAVLDEPGAPARLLESIAELTLKIRALPMPTIARVNGAAIGGGCGLACVCDLGVTHHDSKMGYPEVDLGVCPAVVAPWLVKKIGAGQARRILLEGGTMSGQRAWELGLVTECVAADQLDQAVRTLAERIASGGPRALRATKSWLNELDGSLDAAQVRRGAMISAEVVGGEEAQRSLRAKFAGR